MSDSSSTPPAPARRRKTPRAVWLTAALLLLALASGGWLIQHRVNQKKPGPASFAPASGVSGAAGGTGAAGAAGAGGATGAGGTRAQPVSVGEVQRKSIRQWVTALGTLTASNTATVRPKVDGELVALLFKEGQMVRAGEVLARIDARSLDAQVLQAQGQLAKDAAQLANAQLDLKRYEDLLAKGAIARQQVENQAALVRQLQGTVEAGQAQLQLAQLQRSFADVRAPISGRLGLKQADLGALVRSTDPNGLVTIAQTQPMTAMFAIPEVHVAALQRQWRGSQSVRVEAWSRDDQSLLAVGSVSSTDNAIDTATGTLRIKASLPNPKGELFPNQFANMRLLIHDFKDSLAVPTAAVQRGALGTFVYVVGEGGKVRTEKIQLLAVEGDWQAVTGALRVGERVVTDGADRLRDGSVVQVMTTPTRPKREEPAQP